MSRLSKDHQKRAGFIFLAVLFSLIPLFSAESASLVPCGGPGQTDCNICWFFVLARQVMDFLVFQAAAAFAAVCLALSGALFLMSGDNPGRYEAGKKIATSVFVGFWVMLAGWLFINTFFMVFGVSEWSGLKEGWWKVKATCASSEDDIVLSCGDGLVTGEEDCDPNEQTANCQGRTGGSKEHCDNIHERCDATTCKLAASLECGDGIVQAKNNEECEPKEPIDKCRNRTGATAEECEGILKRCSEDCKLAVDSDDDGDDDEMFCAEENEKIGMGCYLDENGDGQIGENECKKGKYICDQKTGKLRCEGDGSIIDYCCTSDFEELADGKIGNKPFTIVRAQASDVHLTGGKKMTILGSQVVDLDKPGKGLGIESGLTGGFICDEVCKKVGKICVGVGLTDPSKDACVYQIHDNYSPAPDAEKCLNVGSQVISMEISENRGFNNCKGYFGLLYYSDKGKRMSGTYDKYVYFCAVYDPNFNKTLAYDPKFTEVPDDSCGVCKPKAAAGEKCTGSAYKQDPSDSCAFHGNDIGETACYCY